MALNINTSGLNDSLRRLASFFMQNKLGELSNQRYMDTISEQDRLMRERGAEADVRARGLKQYESKINLDEHIKKAFIDTAKSNDAFDYNVRAAQVAREAGDEAKAKALYGRAYELAIPNLTARMNALKGKANEQDFLATMEAFGEDGVEKLMSESGQAGRAATSAGLEEKRQGVDIQKLGLEKAKFGLEKEKFDVEQGGPGGMGDKQRKEYIDYITDTEKYLIDQGVKGEKIGSSVRDFMGSYKYLDPMSKENRGKSLTYLGEIRLQLIQGIPPTPPQLSFLSKIKNVSAIEGGTPTPVEGQEVVPGEQIGPTKPSGLPSPTTGLYGQEAGDAEAKINDNMLVMITNQIMQRLGLGEDKRGYATGLAREFLAGLK
jgi:hypothetical protein